MRSQPETVSAFDHSCARERHEESSEHTESLASTTDGFATSGNAQQLPESRFCYHVCRCGAIECTPHQRGANQSCQSACCRRISQTCLASLCTFGVFFQRLLTPLTKSGSSFRIELRPRTHLGVLPAISRRRHVVVESEVTQNGARCAPPLPRGSFSTVLQTHPTGPDRRDVQTSPAVVVPNLANASTRGRSWPRRADRSPLG